MAMKDFNFKQFMLQKGEWVGLGFALVIMLPVLVFGMMKIVTSGSPAGNARNLQQLADAADQRIAGARPPADADQPPKELSFMVTYDRVDPDAYHTPTEWFIASSIEDTRRRSPDILPPGEFHVGVVRGGVKGHILDTTGKRVMVITQKSLLVIKNRKTKKIYKLDQKLAGAGSYGSRGMMPGMPGGGGERGSSVPGYQSPGGGAAAGGLGGVPSTSFQDIDKVGNSQDVRLAEQIYPVRMAVITGTFPFKQQMEEFRRALKKRTLDELFAMFTNEEASWQFVGFKIQRRVLYPNGNIKTAWQDYDEQLNNKFAGLFAVAVDYDKEEEDYYKYEGILNRGLVMVRPQLERGQYPKVEADSLKSAITALDKQSQGPEVKRPLSDLARKLQNKGVNPWDPLNPLLTEEEEEANKAQPSQPPAPSSDKKAEKPEDADADLLIPDKALVRFMDVTVEPGFVYEYRVKVKMANPNYHKTNLAYAGLRDKKEIEASDWTLVPRVEVPPDIYYYALDEKPDREKAIMQIHRWVDTLLKDAQNERTSTPLGDWTIAEKLPVHRGEYVGRLEPTKVPVWNIEKEDFELAVNPKNRRENKIPVDYTVRTSKALDPALLVDYQGAKDFQERLEVRTPDSNKPKSSLAIDTVPVQMLILTPEGRLVVHNYQDDNGNEERVARHKAWKDWINEVESGRRRPKADDMLDQLRGGGKSN